MKKYDPTEDPNGLFSVAQLYLSTHHGRPEGAETLIDLSRARFNQRLIITFVGIIFLFGLVGYMATMAVSAPAHSYARTFGLMALISAGIFIFALVLRIRDDRESLRITGVKSSAFMKDVKKFERGFGHNLLMNGLGLRAHLHVKNVLREKRHTREYPELRMLVQSLVPGAEV
jgi:hypothetical protein